MEYIIPHMPTGLPCAGSGRWAAKRRIVFSVIRDILHIFIYYLIQLIETENMMKVRDYSVEVIIATFQIFYCEECLLSYIIIR